MARYSMGIKMAKLETDANGVVTSGRFAGRHVDEVMDYLEGLEAAVTDENRHKPTNEPPVDDSKTKGDEAAKRLAAAAAGRVDPIQQQTLFRLEQDDEESFRATVPDYDAYKEKIDKIKQTLHPAQRAQKNLHRTLYINVKSEDVRVAKRIFEKIEDKPTETAEEKAAREAKEAADKAEADRVAAEAAARASGERRPKAAPPMASPTPASRPAPTRQSNDRKPKLVATPKIEAFCRATRRDVNSYLLQLEDQGVTQEAIDTAGQMGRRENPRSVYDRPRAARS